MGIGISQHGGFFTCIHDYFAIAKLLHFCTSGDTRCVTTMNARCCSVCPFSTYELGRPFPKPIVTITQTNSCMKGTSL